jgi:hypothetical protein
LLVIVDRYYSAAQILGDAVKSAELPLNVEPLEKLFVIEAVIP